MDRRLQTLAEWLHDSEYPVFFTGAGLSTDSGLPDFRGPDGVWTRRDKGLPPRPGGVPWDRVDPNAGHFALFELQRLGRLKFLISQNVDNLHLKSGIEPKRLAELHGNVARLRCRRCETTFDKADPPERCDCGGELTSSVVDFGMSLPVKDLDRSLRHARQSDLFVVIGSSLVVTPAAHMPAEAYQAGARLVIVNQQETPLDPYARLRFHEPIGEVLPAVVERLKKIMVELP